MRLRDGDIIACDCGAELNPEITTPADFIKYVNGIATCSFCGESGAISFPQPETPATPINDIQLLRDKNDALENLISQTSTDFSAFMDFFFEMNPDLA